MKSVDCGRSERVTAMIADKRGTAIKHNKELNELKEREASTRRRGREML